MSLSLETVYVLIHDCFFSSGDPLVNDDEEEGIEQEDSEKIQTLSENEKPHVLKGQCDRYNL